MNVHRVAENGLPDGVPSGLGLKVVSFFAFLAEIARMSKFVNYKKRSVALPAGCKNLIDLLGPHGVPKLVGSVPAGSISPHERPTVTRGESVAGRLSGIEKYVTMVFESRTPSFILLITPPDERFRIQADRMQDGKMRVSVMVQAGTDRERAVRSFLAYRGLQVPEDAEMPPQFIPDLPVHITYDISPLPSEASVLSRLIAGLSRDAFGLSDDSELRFRYYEFRDVT